MLSTNMFENKFAKKKTQILMNIVIFLPNSLHVCIPAVLKAPSAPPPLRPLMRSLRLLLSVSVTGIFLKRPNLREFFLLKSLMRAESGSVTCPLNCRPWGVCGTFLLEISISNYVPYGNMINCG